MYIETQYRNSHVEYGGYWFSSRLTRKRPLYYDTKINYKAPRGCKPPRIVAYNSLLNMHRYAYRSL